MNIKLQDLKEFSNIDASAKFGLNNYTSHRDKKQQFISNWIDEESKDSIRADTYYNPVSTRLDLKCGMTYFSFIQLDKDRYLLISVGKITGYRDRWSTFEVVNEYDKYIDRLIIRVDKRNSTKMGSHIFKFKQWLDEDRIEISEILNQPYGKLEFNGYENVHLQFGDLLKIINNEKFNEYKSHLSAVNGIYLLTDSKTNKRYVGSAYGENGICQRWECYLNTYSGNNKQLVDLLKVNGIDYFKDYFKFKILETFDKNTSVDKIISRENHWKEVLMTRIEDFGYNDN